MANIWRGRGSEDEEGVLPPRREVVPSNAPTHGGRKDSGVRRKLNIRTSSMNKNGLSFV